MRFPNDAATPTGFNELITGKCHYYDYGTNEQGKNERKGVVTESGNILLCVFGNRNSSDEGNLK